MKRILKRIASVSFKVTVWLAVIAVVVLGLWAAGHPVRSVQTYRMASFNTDNTNGVFLLGVSQQPTFWRGAGMEYYYFITDDSGARYMQHFRARPDGVEIVEDPDLHDQAQCILYREEQVSGPKIDVEFRVPPGTFKLATHL
jgi:hypothetical protein